MTSAEMLAFCQDMALEPSTSTLTSSALWYRLLTQGEAYWKPIIATHYPNDMLTVPLILTNSGGSDANKVFLFPGSVRPIYVEIYPSLRGPRMFDTIYNNAAGDYVFEGDRIRIPANRSRAFADGAPYARYVTPAGTIDGSTQSTIEPTSLHVLNCWHALWLYALRHPEGDADAMYKAEQTAAFGNAPGDIGLLGALKNQPQHGAAGTRVWYRPA